MENYFITGVAGFIGSNLVKRILKDNKDVNVIGLDNLNDYYDIRIKESRLNDLKKYDKFKFINGDLSNKKFLKSTILRLLLI